jgi:hypothetical protein
MDVFEKIIQRDMKYPFYMDWSVVEIDENITCYRHPSNKNKFVSIDNKLVNKGFEKEFILKIVSHYHGLKNHRINGPAKIIITHYTKNIKHINYEVYWKNRGEISRKNGPSTYFFRKDEFNNVEIDALKWHKKSFFHKLNGPAVFTKNQYTFYIDGVAFTEHQYWLTMLKYYPKNMPKIVFEDNVKIIFKYLDSKPSPFILYKNVKRVTYALPNDNNVVSIVNKLDYWKKTYKRFAIKKNWLITDEL